MLFKVILVSVALHVVAGFVACVITIANVVIKEEAQFDEPPVVEQEEPPKEVKVTIKPQPPKQQNIEQQLKMRPVGNIALAQVDVALPSMEHSFTVNAGLGGISRGNLLAGARGGLGMKMPEIDFFGAKSKGEKIVFIVHFGPATTSQWGRSTPYTRMTNYVIRKRLEELVEGLPAQALFNVAGFWMSHCSPFSDRMLPANGASKDLLREWIATVNPVEGSDQTYGSSFSSEFSKRLSGTPWPQRIDRSIPSFGPAWYYNYVTPQSVEQQYFEPSIQEPTVHWARGLFWALMTQKPDTIYILTTNYLPDQLEHPKAIADAYRKISADHYELAGFRPPTINVVVLSNVGVDSAEAKRVLDERFRPLIRASKGRGSVIGDIRDFMNQEERRRLNSYDNK